MIYLVLVAIFVSTPCLAVKSGDVSNKQFDHQTGSSYSIIPQARWQELYKQIYQYHDFEFGSINTLDYRSILDEMYSIERSGSIEMSVFNELAEQPIVGYKRLIKEAYEANLLLNQDTTLTSVLLQTFDYESNDCNSGYFNLINNLADAFRNLPFGLVLNENRRSQYRNCWERLMDSMVASSNLIGLKSRNSLNELLTIIYPVSNEIIIPKSDTMHPLDESELVRMSNLIGKFLMDKEEKDKLDPKQDYGRIFEHFIIIPCKELIDKTKSISEDIYEMLLSTNDLRESIGVDDSTALNRHMLCNQIIENSEIIGPNVLQYIAIMSNNNQPVHFGMSHDNEIDLFSEPKLEYVNDDNYNDYDLVTQYLALDDYDDQDNQDDQVNQDFDDDQDDQDVEAEENKGLILGKTGNESEKTESDQEVEPASKRRKLISTDLSSRADLGEKSTQTNQDNQEQHQADSTPFVVDIKLGFGRGRNAKYLTTWSDGAKTCERKSFLSRNWPHVWNSLYYERKARTQVRYYNKQRSRPEPRFDDEPLLLPTQTKLTCREDEIRAENAKALSPKSDEFLINPIPGPRRVMLVGPGQGRGLNTKYPTYWSDGTKSMENKKFLETEWSEPYSRLLRNQRLARQKRWSVKRKRSNRRNNKETDE